MDSETEERLDRLERSIASLTEAVEMIVDERSPDELVEQISTGASARSEITRGTGTRDQEKHVIKGKGADADEALDEYEQQLEEFENEYIPRIRAIQPVGEEDDDG